MNRYVITHQFNPSLAAIPQFGQPGFFFNEGIHLRQQSNRPLHLLTAINTATNQADARCAFFDDHQVALSPAAAPFGSIEFTATLPNQTLESLLNQLVLEAQHAGLSRIHIRNYPDCYAPRQIERLINQLDQQNFQLVAQTPTFFIPVTTQPLEPHMQAQERRRLRKGQQAGFQFLHWTNPVIDEVIRFWQHSRTTQHYALTIPASQLRSLLQQFPDQFPVFIVRDQQQIAAMSIGVRVRQDILYLFLPIDNLAYRPLSPMVFLLHSLYIYCQKASITLLDLGTSLDHNHQPKPSLERFKRNMGAHSSFKRCFEKRL